MSWTGTRYTIGFALALGLVSAYGLAQPKSAAPAKLAEDCTCDNGGCTADCSCGACAKHAGSANFTCDAGACRGQAGVQCPLTELAALAEVKIEKTRTGATLQLTAKDPNRAAQVQVMADKLAEHIKAGGCPMERSGHGMMRHGHHHGAMGAPATKAASPAAPAAAKK